MKENPRLEWNGAPPQLPEVGEMALEREKYYREIHWMAQQFWFCMEKIDLLRAIILYGDKDCSDSFTDGYTQGLTDGLKQAKEILLK